MPRNLEFLRQTWQKSLILSDINAKYKSKIIQNKNLTFLIISEETMFTIPVYLQKKRYSR